MYHLQIMFAMYVYIYMYIYVYLYAYKYIYIYIIGVHYVGVLETPYISLTQYVYYMYGVSSTPT